MNFECLNRNFDAWCDFFVSDDVKAKKMKNKIDTVLTINMSCKLPGYRGIPFLWIIVRNNNYKLSQQFYSSE